MRRVHIALASVVVLGGAALAWGATRGHDEDPEYDEERAMAAHRHTRSDQIVVPEGFRLAKATKLAPVDSHAVTMFVDGRSVRMGDRSFDLSESVGRPDCSVPMTFVHALEWERRLADVVDGGIQHVNVVVEASLPWDVARSALGWLSCERVDGSLILSTPSGTIGTVPRYEFRRSDEPRVHISISSSGYEVSRGPRVPRALDETNVRYGAGCTPDVEGVSVPMEADDDTLTKCIAKAFGDEMEGQHYIDSIPGISLSAARKVPFEKVVRAIVSGETVAPVFF